MLSYGASKELADLLLREACGGYPIDLGNEVSWEEAPDGCRAKGLDCGEHGDTLAVSPLAEYLVVQADTAYILAGLCQ
jgi:hypothetical protein